MIGRPRPPTSLRRSRHEPWSRTRISTPPSTTAASTSKSDANGPLAPSNAAWANGVSAFGIDGASITGDNPVADAYLGQSGGSNSTTGWRNDREGWLGGLLGDEGWRVGGLF